MARNFYQSDCQGRVYIVEDDFLEEFAQVHLGFHLMSHADCPQLDLENISRSGILDEFEFELLE